MSNGKARPPMRRVCILTKEGREYTPEGLMHVSAEIEKRFQVKGPFAGLMGADYNKPSELLDVLNEFPNAFIVISTEENIIYTNSENFNVQFTEALNANPETSCWETALNCYKAQNN